ncbi:MAG: hypothetical protein EOP09_10655, partial [Proteobacteria bacterium]
MRHWITKAFKAWEKFWLSSSGEAQMRTFRRLLGIHLFIAYAVRALDWRFLFSEQGVASWSAMREILPMQYRFSLFEWFPSNAAVLTGTFVFLGLLLLWIVGKRSFWIDLAVF